MNFNNQSKGLCFNSNVKHFFGVLVCLAHDFSESNDPDKI